jgi:hypothetical protein
LFHAPAEEKDELAEGSFYDKHNQIYQRIPAHDTTVIVGDFNTKIGREVFKPVAGRWSMHETLNESEIRAIILLYDNKSTYIIH